MLYKTNGIVLGFIRYRDTSIIVRIYTEAFGLRSYIINGVRSAKNKNNKIALYQPFTLLDMLVYNKPNTDLNYISESKIYQPFHSIPFDIHKTTICLFLTEVLTKVLKSDEADQELFDFLMNSILSLENLPQGFENFHLQFLIRLSGFLGFYMVEASEIGEQLQRAGYLFDYESYTLQMNNLISADYGAVQHIPNKIRSEILNALLKFYQLHFEGFGEIKSLNILREIY
ncbi:MAG: DNA repair protein RecO [Cytophagales bacterium]|nr:MAG: DNA repair protein RecO [Cytophagales bacterium]